MGTCLRGVHKNVCKLSWALHHFSRCKNIHISLSVSLNATSFHYDIFGISRKSFVVRVPYTSSTYKFQKCLNGFMNDICQMVSGGTNCCYSMSLNVSYTIDYRAHIYYTLLHLCTFIIFNMDFLFSSSTLCCPWCWTS